MVMTFGVSARRGTSGLAGPLPDWVATALVAGLFLFMLVQPRGFVAAVLGLAVVLAAGLLAAAGGRFRPAWQSLALLALAAAASLATLLDLPAIPEADPLNRLGQPWLMLLAGLAAFELLRHGRLQLPGWMLPAGLMAILLAWLAMIGLSFGVPALSEGTDLAKLSLVGHPFAKALFLATPAAWLLAALWLRAGGGRPALWAFALPAFMALTSPSQSLSLGLAFGVVLALLATRPAGLAVGVAAILLIPLATVLVAPELMARGLALPENWSWRVELWSEGVRLALERPLTGWGLQSYRELRDTLMELPRINHAHSIAVELLLDFGIWGLAGLAALAAAVIAVARRWGHGLDPRLLAVPPLVTWLTVASVSLGLWTDFVFGGTVFVLVLALARIAPQTRHAALVAEPRR